MKLCKFHKISVNTGEKKKFTRRVPSYWEAKIKYCLAKMENSFIFKACLRNTDFQIYPSIYGCKY